MQTDAQRYRLLNASTIRWPNLPPANPSHALIVAQDSDSRADNHQYWSAGALPPASILLVPWYRCMCVFHYSDRGFSIVVAMGDYQRDDFHVELERTFAGLTDAPAAGLLIDVSESSVASRRSGAEIRATATTIARKRHLFASRLAIVATTELPLDPLGKDEVSTSDDGLQTELFRDYERALEWLAGVELPAITQAKSA